MATGTTTSTTSRSLSGKQILIGVLVLGGVTLYPMARAIHKAENSINVPAPSAGTDGVAAAAATAGAYFVRRKNADMEDWKLVTTSPPVISWSPPNLYSATLDFSGPSEAGRTWTVDLRNLGGDEWEFVSCHEFGH